MSMLLRKTSFVISKLVSSKRVMSSLTDQPKLFFTTFDVTEQVRTFIYLLSHTTWAYGHDTKYYFVAYSFCSIYR